MAPPWLGSYSVKLAPQALKGGTLAGVLLCRLAPQALKGAPWVGSCSVVQCVGRLIGQPLCCSAADADVSGEDTVMAPTATCDSAVSPCCPPWHFPPQSPPSHPFNTSFCRLQQPFPWDYSTIPKLQLPATAHSRRPAFLSRVCTAVARTV